VDRAGELEHRWNEALQTVRRIEGEIADIIARKPPPLDDQKRQQLIELGADLERAWTHPAATAATRKRILRAALNEVVVRREGAIIDAVLHWQGGDHTALHVKQRLNAVGRHNPRTPEDTIALVRELVRDLGYIEGRNIVIQFRWAEGVDQLRELATELVRMNVDVIVAQSSTEAVSWARGNPRAARRKHHGPVDPADGARRQAAGDIEGSPTAQYADWGSLE
jgi:hypothetical protein